MEELEIQNQTGNIDIELSDEQHKSLMEILEKTGKTVEDLIKERIIKKEKSDTERTKKLRALMDFDKIHLDLFFKIEWDGIRKDNTGFYKLGDVIMTKKGNALVIVNIYEKTDKIKVFKFPYVKGDPIRTLDLKSKDVWSGFEFLIRR